MFAHEFMRNAFLAGTFVALACGAGRLVRRAARARSSPATRSATSPSPARSAAAALGIDIRLGLFAATLVVGAGIGGLGARARADDVVIGTVFAWVLGLGALFLSIFVSGSSGADGTAAVRVLFGSILGLSPADAWLAAAIAVAAARRPRRDRPAAAPRLARPGGGARPAASRCGRSASPFSSSSARSPPRRPRRSAPCCCWDCWPRPAGAARLLTDRPWLGSALSAAIAVGSTWLGLLLAYEIDSLPAGTAIIGVATAVFLLAALRDRLRQRPASRRRTFPRIPRRNATRGWRAGGRG